MPSPPIPLSHLEGSPEPERRYRLLELVRRRMAELRYSPRSVATYASWIRRYVVFNDRRHPRDLGPDAVRRFLSHLARKEHVAAATQNQALAALTFLYDRVLGQPLERVDGIAPARRSRHVPVVLSQHEVRLVLAQLDDPARLCVSLMYGSGLRLSECVGLRVKDVDFDRHEVVVRGGKGGKDRRTPLAESTHGPLQRWLRGQERGFARDLRGRVGTTGVSDALRRKFPNIDREWSWRYVFPSLRTTRDAQEGLRRHHLDPSVVQRAMVKAVRAASIVKRSDVRTTMIYTHVLNRGGLGVRSPADRL